MISEATASGETVQGVEGIARELGMVQELSQGVLLAACLLVTAMSAESSVGLKTSALQNRQTRGELGAFLPVLWTTGCSFRQPACLSRRFSRHHGLLRGACPTKRVGTNRATVKLTVKSTSSESKEVAAGSIEGRKVKCVFTDVDGTLLNR